MPKGIQLSELAEMCVLWPGDIHALASFMLNVCEANDQAANARNPHGSQESRPTLGGVVRELSRLTDVPTARIRNRLGTLGLDLSASMEFDAGEKPASGG